ncbi:MAG: Urea ABC transporter, permease protein UrtB [uncultured Thiotrichaceae bacterium]|uniref:Urea ABC transporter, permease protein UrtB n=1 Tax=uncultured Thiotrichaceae bacterium TaxID=298394 RepID=A0A6S6ST88_9GAMM|nr:MAG: Urea ABC transporter, permease protein UrtB [uncultured Thiotrichaceae bacterium]
MSYRTFDATKHLRTIVLTAFFSVIANTTVWAEATSDIDETTTTAPVQTPNNSISEISTPSSSDQEKTDSVEENSVSDTTKTIPPSEDVFAVATSLLTEKSFKKKEQAIDLLINSNDERAKQWLAVMLKGKLYYHKQDKFIAFVQGSKITQAANNEVLENTTKKAFKKVTINNKLRKLIKAGIAKLSLSSPDPETRLKSVNTMLGNITPESAEILAKLADNEKDKKVRKAMLLGMAMSTLNTGTKEQQLQAIKDVSGSLHASARSRLSDLKNSDDKDISAAAIKALEKIETKVKMYGHAETLFFGLSLGSVLVLAAIGLAITFGVMGVINMAHGELIMLGAYTTYIVQQLMPKYIDYSLFVAIPLAFIVSGIVGILIERTVIRHLYGRPLETLLATFGISLILQQLVRTVISPQNVPVSNPSWMSGALEVNSILSLTYNRLYIILFCLLVFAALFYIMRNSSLGLQVRAVSQNRNMARAMGVRSARVDALTFGLGSGIAGVAGVALSQLTNVGPNLGQAYIIDSFMVVVFGGVGNLWGTLVAGLSLGVINKVMEPWAGAVLAKILVLIFIILFIQKRPRGLFPQKGRAAGD